MNALNSDTALPAPARSDGSSSLITSVAAGGVAALAQEPCSEAPPGSGRTAASAMSVGSGRAPSSRISSTGFTRCDRRWRAASKHRTVPAMATLSDSADGPLNGIVTSASSWPASSGGRPCASLPRTSATGAGQVDLVGRGPAGRRSSRCTVARPARSAPSTSTGSSPSTIASPKIAPADERTTFGPCGSTELPQHTTPAAPDASALRISVPTFPGSCDRHEHEHETVAGQLVETLESHGGPPPAPAAASRRSPTRSSTPSLSSAMRTPASRTRATSGANARSAPGPEVHGLERGAPIEGSGDDPWSLGDERALLRVGLAPSRPSARSRLLSRWRGPSGSIPKPPRAPRGPRSPTCRTRRSRGRRGRRGSCGRPRCRPPSARRRNASTRCRAGGTRR